MRGRQAIRVTGWASVLTGLGVVLWLLWSLVGTNYITARAQDRLLDRWQTQVGTVDPATSASLPPATSTVPPPVSPPPPTPASDVGASAAPSPAGAGESVGTPGEAPGEASGAASGEVPGEALAAEEPDALAAVADVGRDEPAMAGVLVEAERPGEPVALLRFRRPGAAGPPVSATPYVVVDGVDAATLRTGPGHYPGTAAPGGDGNMAVAGHRTTYGAPFFHLDELRTGDEVLVTDTAGRTSAYVVRSRRIVLPTDTSVLDADPLGTGRPQLTLTTCHPRFSAARRLVVHAELV